jgi:hypothetical protein
MLKLHVEKADGYYNLYISRIYVGISTEDTYPIQALSGIMDLMTTQIESDNPQILIDDYKFRRHLISQFICIGDYKSVSEKKLSELANETRT